MCVKSDALAQMSVADREQEVMSAAGLASIGGSGTVGHGVMERVLRIAPGACNVRAQPPAPDHLSFSHSNLRTTACTCWARTL